MSTIQSIIFGDTGVQITYVRDDAVDRTSGIAEITILEIPHGAVDESFISELVEDAEQLIEEARVVLRKPVQSFTAPR